MSQTELISRAILFDTNFRSKAKLAPCGKLISYIAQQDAHQCIHIHKLDDLRLPVTVISEQKQDIHDYHWSVCGRYVIYSFDIGGDENTLLSRIDLDTYEKLRLTTGDHASRFLHISSHHPDKIAISMNRRDSRYFDIYHLDIKDGAQTLVYENNQFAEIFVDNALQPRMASRADGRFGLEVLSIEADGKLAVISELAMEDYLTFQVYGFDNHSSSVYIKTSRARDTAVLVRLCLETGKEEELFCDPHSDIEDLWLDPCKHRPLAVSTNLQRVSWHPLDPSMETFLQTVTTRLSGDIQFAGYTEGEPGILICEQNDSYPPQYYLWHENEAEPQHLFSANDALSNFELSSMQPIVIQARDGLQLNAYLTQSKIATELRPSPMVLLIHGGPWERDRWGYEARHQWLANRGYAVLSVNYRGSTGFGKEFLKAGFDEWGNKMQDDLEDAALWAIQKQIADPERIAIYGGSYGGFAALSGIMRNPELFTCCISKVGPVDLVKMLEKVPPYWEWGKNFLSQAVGDIEDENSRKKLEKLSPVNNTEKFSKPTLIVAGQNDIRVRIAEIDQFVSTLKSQSAPVSYIVFKDEGHSFTHPENSMKFYGIVEHFLSIHLGGKCEALSQEISTSMATIPEAEKILEEIENSNN